MLKGLSPAISIRWNCEQKVQWENKKCSKPNKIEQNMLNMPPWRMGKLGIAHLSHLRKLCGPRMWSPPARLVAPCPCFLLQVLDYEGSTGSEWLGYAWVWHVSPYRAWGFWEDQDAQRKVQGQNDVDLRSDRDETRTSGRRNPVWGSGPKRAPAGTEGTDKSLKQTKGVTKDSWRWLLEEIK